jgi:hypothetical protein
MGRTKRNPSFASEDFVPKANKSAYTKKDLRQVSNNPQLTKADIAKARPFSEVFPELSGSVRRDTATRKMVKRKVS